MSARVMIQVAVIGAGAAGLCISRHLLARPDVFTATIYEQTSRVGGTWVYSDHIGIDHHGQPLHSSMYKNLKTNLPKQVMVFPDYPFPDELDSYLTHAEVCKYLEDYAKHFSVTPNITFNTAVELVKPRFEDDKDLPRWEVTVKNLDDKKQSTGIFDAVVVCNGHYSVPRTPNIPGKDKFPGILLHSHDYRHPEKFTGMDVVLLGAGASGLDIAIDLSKTASKVYLSHNKDKLTSQLPKNLEQMRGIKGLLPDGRIVFDDGEERKADALMFCTGYDFSFPFLDKESGVSVHDNHIKSLYKQLFNVKYPNMSFIGLPYRICPFPQFHLQAEYIIAMLTGNVHLPSEADMLADSEQDYKNILAEGFPERYAHFLGPKQWEYNDMIADLAKCDKLIPVVKNLYEYTWAFRKDNILTYKDREYQVMSEESFKEITPSHLSS